VVVPRFVTRHGGYAIAMTDDRQDVAESLDDDRIDDAQLENMGGEDLRALHQAYPPEKPLGVDDRIEEEDSLDERATIRRWRQGEGAAMRPAGDDLLDDREPQLVVDEWDTATDDPSAEELALHQTPPPPMRPSDSYLQGDADLPDELDDVEVEPGNDDGGLDEAPNEFDEPGEQRAS
jgi:hypothetical protein